jgi:hypothetical protein
VVDEDAGQVVADGPVHEHRRRRRIDPAGEAADGPGIPYLLPYPLHSVGDDVDRRPLRLAAARLVQEVLEDVHPVLRVPDFRVELHPVASLFHVLEGDDGHRRGFGRYLEAFGEGEDGVAVARPDLLLVGGAGEEAFLVFHDQVGAAVLPDLDGPNLPALQQGHQLHPVADTQHRHAEFEERGVHPRGAVFVDGIRAAGEDDPFGVAALYLLH